MTVRFIGKKTFVLFSSLLFTLHAWSCTVDVQIVQGNSVTVCNGAENSISATTGFVSYTWSGPVVGNNELATPTGTGWIYVEATDNVGCVSEDSILVSFHPQNTPVLSSSEGVVICSSINGTTLSVNQAYNSYLWGDGSTNPTLFVTESGEYDVWVTDANGCEDSASISIEFIEFNLQAVGGNTVCSGSVITLVASGGDVYAWSTNEFTNTIVVGPTQPTTYTVTIYKGACHETLSITINVTDLPEITLPNVVYVMPGEIKYIYGPADFDTYSWAPAENVTATSGPGTGYVGVEDGYITLTATSNSLGCSMMHTTYFKIIELTIPEGFSPNGDGINDLFVIPEIYGFQASLKVWNRWGDIVFKSDLYRNEWDGTCKGGLCLGSDVVPEGSYFYLLTIDGYEYKGYITIKL